MGLITLSLFIGFGIASWFIYVYKIGESASLGVWLNGHNVSFLSLFVGLFANMVFGFIDNFGLFFGSNFLDEWFMMLPGSEDANIFAC